MTLNLDLITRKNAKSLTNLNVRDFLQSNCSLNAGAHPTQGTPHHPAPRLWQPARPHLSPCRPLDLPSTQHLSFHL